MSFDVHGTLILPQPGIGAIYAEVGQSFGLPHSAQALGDAFGPAFRSVYKDWEIPYGSDESDARTFWSRVIHETFITVDPTSKIPSAVCFTLFDRFGEGRSWRVLPGAREALALAEARQIPSVVCSNFDMRVNRILSDLRLGPFTDILTSALVGAAKPDPELILMASTVMDCEPFQILHIGDNEREDGGACRAAPCAWMHVPCGQGIDMKRLVDILNGREEPDFMPGS